MATGFARLAWLGVALVGLLGGCGGGGGSDSTVSPLAGVWTGTLADPSGTNMTLETEHVATGAAIRGSARMVAGDGSIHHGALSGTETTAGMDWTVDFKGSVGIVDFKGTRNGRNMTLTYARRATPGASGTGALNLTQAGGIDLRGTYNVDWIANNQAGSFQFTVVNDAGVNAVPYQEVQLVNALMAFSGSCIGSTISVAATVFAGVPGNTFTQITMHFGGAAAGSSGLVTGTQTVQTTATQILGQYKLTKVSG